MKKAGCQWILHGFDGECADFYGKWMDYNVEKGTDVNISELLNSISFPAPDGLGAPPPRRRVRCRRRAERPYATANLPAQVDRQSDGAPAVPRCRCSSPPATGE